MCPGQRGVLPGGAGCAESSGRGRSQAVAAAELARRGGKVPEVSVGAS